MTTATDLATIIRCEHRIHMDAVGNPDQRMPTGAFLQLLWECGRAHEDGVIADLQVEPVSEHLPLSERESETRRLMQKGVPLIYHGYLEHSDLTGEPDLLERVEERSALGPHSYIPVDIKSGGAFESDGKTPKKTYLMQLCAYAELLEAHQGVRPRFGKIIDADGTWQTLDLSQAWALYLDLRSQIDSILAGAEVTRPGLKSDCSNCAWQRVCREVSIQIDDLTTVAGVGPAYREKLESIGIKTALGLSQASPDSLLAVKGIGATYATAWPRQAAVQKNGEPLLLEPWIPPDVDFEVFYDIEDFTPNPFVYLHGFLTREISAAKYGDHGFSDADWGLFEPLMAKPGELERDLWKRFLARIKDYEERGDYAVYVYSHHERSTLAKLEAEYGGSKALKRFLERFVDLLRESKRSVVFPTWGYGLKALARFIGFEWRDEDPGGAESMAWWNEYQSEPAENAHLRERILRYNEDDVRATLALRDWLENFSAKPQL